MIHWAQTIGPNTARLFEKIMSDKPHPGMGYRGCLGVIRLAGKYSAQRVEDTASESSVRRNSVISAMNVTSLNMDRWWRCYPVL